MIINSRWRFVIIGFAMMLVIGLLDAWSIFVLPLEQEFGWGRDQTALAYSLAMIFLALGILIGGPLVDSKGPRVVSLIAGSLLCTGFVLSSCINSLMQLYITYSLLCGTAIGILYNCIIATVVRWFPDKRGLVTGMLMVGSGAGSMMLGVGVTPLFQIFGWRTVFQILGIVSLVVIVLPGQLLRNPPVSWQGAEKKASFKVGVDYNWREVLHMPSFWLIWLWHVGVISGGQASLGHIVPFAVEKGVSFSMAAITMGILAVFNAIGRVLFGFLSDKYGRKIVMCLASFMMAAAMSCLATLIPFWGLSGLMIATILTGIAYGGAIPQVSGIVASFYGQKHFGANFGLLSTGIAVASVIGPYLTGYTKAVTGSYELSFYFLSITALFSGVIALYIKNPTEKVSIDSDEVITPLLKG